MYFLDEFIDDDQNKVVDEPDYLHMMRHVVRSAHPVEPPKLMKSISKTEGVLAMYQHWPSVCMVDGVVRKSCDTIYIDESVAYLAHYR